MDDNGNKKLDLEEFTNALNTFGIFPKVTEIQALMKYYDINCDGNIGYEEFIRGLREPLSERRSGMVEAAFKLMDKDGSGKLTTADISQVFDVTNN
jgi:Ca2+-binding EF-hand superfamily protein